MMPAFHHPVGPTATKNVTQTNYLKTVFLLLSVATHDRVHKCSLFQGKENINSLEINSCTFSISDSNTHILGYLNNTYLDCKTPVFVLAVLPDHDHPLTYSYHRRLILHVSASR